MGIFSNLRREFIVWPDDYKATVMRQAFSPVQRAWLNRSLDSANRATLFSVDGQADAVGQIVGGPIIGLVASGISIRAALIGSAALLSLALPLFARALVQAPGPRLKPDFKSTIQPSIMGRTPALIERGNRWLGRSD